MRVSASSCAHFGQPVNGYLEGSPPLAVEIVSANNTAYQIDAKMEGYLSHGGEEVWVVYPKHGHMWIASNPQAGY